MNEISVDSVDFGIWWDDGLMGRGWLQHESGNGRTRNAEYTSIDEAEQAVQAERMNEPLTAFRVLSIKGDHAATREDIRKAAVRLHIVAAEEQVRKWRALL